MKNKKLFNISAEFDLVKKPEWLDSFRSKYDKPFKYHITLKTSTYFEEKDIKEIELEVSRIIKRHPKIPIAFNKLFISSFSEKGFIMIEAEKNEALTNLQKEISTALARYGKHLTAQHKKFEDNFKPHITIGRELTPERFQKSKNDLGKDLHCEALISELVLTVAKENSFREWANPENKSYYKLGSNENNNPHKEISSKLK